MSPVSAVSNIGLNLANELIGKLLLQITETSSAAQNVLIEKRSFREFSSHINKIEPILLELWNKNVQGSSDSLKVPLENFAEQLNNASKLIKTYTSGSWMYLFLKCRCLPDNMKEITQGIERCLNELRIATLDVSLEIKEKTVALCETMRNAEFRAEVGTESLIGEIEKEMQEMQSDSNQVLQLIEQVAKAMNVPMDQCFLESEIEVVRKKKEDLESEKQKAEACMLAQIQEFLGRSGVFSADSSSPVSQAVPQYFYCPLTNKIMENPVDLESGITCERSAIEKRLESGNTTCPVRNCELKSTQLIPNHNLRELIQEWKEKNVKLRIENASMKLMSVGDAEEVEETLVELCNLCRDRSSSRQLVGEKDLIPKILELTSFQLVSIQVKAMECLCYLANENINKEKVANAGGIEKTVNHLTEETGIKNLALSLLLELSKDLQLCRLIGETQNSIPFLVSMLSGPHAEKSREVLNNLSKVDGNIIAMAEVNYYDPLVSQLIQGSPTTKKFLANELSKMEHLDCSKATTPDGGIIPPLLQMISENNPEAMPVPLSALQNLSRMAENSVCILNANVASLLFSLMFLAGLKVDLREQAAEILANLTITSSKERKIHQKLKSLASEENIKKMLESLSLARPSLKVHLLQVLLGLASESSIKLHMRNALGIQVLLTLICDPNFEVRLCVMKLLSCLAEERGENQLAEHLGDTHIKALVARISSTDNEEERAVSVGILCHLPKNNSRIRNVLLEAGALDEIVHLLRVAESRNGSIRGGNPLVENALGALLHFTSPSKLDVQKRALGLGIMPLLVGFLLTGSALSKQRAATALGQISESTMSTGIVMQRKSNILHYVCGWWSSPDPQDICPVHRRICATEASFCLVNAGAVAPLVRTLKERDCQADEAAINALSTLLREDIWEAGLKEIENAKGVEPIVKLLENGSPKAQDKAILVLEKIFQNPEYRNLYAPVARFSLIDLMQQGEASTRRRATGILQLLGEMPEDSGWLQSQ
eukprot:Gb_22324 [translate_table: standard]